MRNQRGFYLLLVAGVLGFLFASISTYDFVAHLDRQVHGLHCSLIPGLGGTDINQESGCHVTLMSPYSSIMRESVWGGVPVSLAAMGVFAFLIGATIVLMRKATLTRAEALGLVAATLVPVAASLGMGTLSFVTLGAACKLCIGIYISSLLSLVGSILVFRDQGDSLVPTRTEPKADDTIPDERPQSLLGASSSPAFGSLVVPSLIVGVLCVVVPVMAYAAVAPDFSKYVGACGELEGSPGQDEALLAIGGQTGRVPVLEVLDPLCPACKGFEKRFSAMPASQDASRRILLFPLDNACNWMISEAIHPGACAIAETVACADRDAEDVLAWAFENQDAIMAATREDPAAAERMAKDRFPGLRGCIGSAKAKAIVNRGLRWAVKHELPILTPQVYVGHKRLCDADTDLGLDYALTRLMASYDPNDAPPVAVEVPALAPSGPRTATPRQPGAPATAGAKTSVPTTADGQTGNRETDTAVDVTRAAGEADSADSADDLSAIADSAEAAAQTGADTNAADEDDNAERSAQEGAAPLRGNGPPPHAQGRANAPAAEQPAAPKSPSANTTSDATGAESNE